MTGITWEEVEEEEDDEEEQEDDEDCVSMGQVGK
jgi:hypothetical protein